MRQLPLTALAGGLMTVLVRASSNLPLFVQMFVALGFSPEQSVSSLTSMEVARKQSEVREALAWCVSALDLAGSDAPPALHSMILDVRARAHLANGALAAGDACQSLDAARCTGALGETLDRVARAAAVLAGAGEVQQAQDLWGRLLQNRALLHWTRVTLERELGEDAPTPDEGEAAGVGTLVVEALHHLSA